ncbi:MAG TPA: hypothetical protein VN999_14515 [Thermoanaerobaculia bacterium]|nr:hypothetical protein [Thermoanaerobaculia bacterium]
MAFANKRRAPSQSIDRETRHTPVPKGMMVQLARLDARFDRVQNSVQIRSPAAVRLIVAYFETLWNDKRTIVLRSAVGMDREAIRRLRSMIMALDPS